jgi:hypothetical protein
MLICVGCVSPEAMAEAQREYQSDLEEAIRTYDVVYAASTNADIIEMEYKYSAGSKTEQVKSDHYYAAFNIPAGSSFYPKFSVVAAYVSNRTNRPVTLTAQLYFKGVLQKSETISDDGGRPQTTLYGDPIRK